MNSGMTYQQLMPGVDSSRASYADRSGMIHDNVPLLADP